jgi:hypothetical protein
MYLDKVVERGLYVVKSELTHVVRLVLITHDDKFYFCDRDCYRLIGGEESKSYFKVLHKVDVRAENNDTYNSGFAPFLNLVLDEAAKEEVQ